MRALRLTLSVLLVLALLSGLAVTAMAAQPSGWWPYREAYYKALESGDESAIIKAGDDFLAFYRMKDIYNTDIAQMMCSIYLWRMENRVYEKRGDNAAAAENAREVAKHAKYLAENGSTDDAELADRAAATAERLAPLAVAYVMTAHPAAGYTYYNAMYAPESGVYYGRSGKAVSGESATSFTVPIETGAVPMWDAVREADDGGRVILIDLVFDNEGAAARAVPTGKYDENIADLLWLMSSMKSPALLSIGGGMDAWKKTCTPDEYKAAYRHIASMARTYAGNAALVFAPNYVSRPGEKAEDFYPGEDVVDWVGVSLINLGNGKDDDARLGYGIYADTVRNASAVVSAFGDKHPVVVTACGAPGEYAANEAKTVLGALTAVYPAIRAVIFADSGKTALSGAALTAYQEAAAANGTLIRRYGAASPGAYMPIDNYREASDRLDFTAYMSSVGAKDLTVRFSLNGKSLETASGMPVVCSVPVKSMNEGENKLTIAFSDGAGFTVTREYKLYRNKNGSVSAGKPDSSAPVLPGQALIPTVPDSGEAAIVKQTVSVDGVPVELPTVRIDLPSGALNYVYIRDLATALSGTAAQFGVGYEGCVKLIRGVPYDGEAVDFTAGFSNKTAYSAGSLRTLIDGAESSISAVSLTDINGGGYTCYQLRDLGWSLGFNVGYAPGVGVFIETARDYDPAN